MTGDEQRSIGRLEGKLDSLIEAVAAQNVSANKRNERLGKIETSIEIGSQVDAQVRDRLDRIDQRIDQEVMPTINKVNGWEKMGMGALAIVGIGGAAVGSAVIWALQHIRFPWQG